MLNFNLTKKGQAALGSISNTIERVRGKYHSSQVFDRVVFECGSYNQCIIDYAFCDKNPGVCAEMIKYGYAK